MSEPAVPNSTCLIALQRIGQLELLHTLFDAVFVPAAVQAEFGTTISWLTVKPVTATRVVDALKTQLGDGEAQAIALALELGKGVAVLDDKKARRIARQMGLRITGTVGVLLRAKRKGILSAVKPLLDALQQADFRLSDELYREALRLAGESIST